MLFHADNASSHPEESITMGHNNGSIMTCDFRQDEIINEQFTRYFCVLYCCIYFHNCRIALFKFWLFSLTFIMLNNNILSGKAYFYLFNGLLSFYRSSHTYSNNLTGNLFLELELWIFLHANDLETICIAYLYVLDWGKKACYLFLSNCLSGNLQKTTK